MVRELLNTLFVMTPDAYVRLEGDTLRVETDGVKGVRVPLQHIGSVMLFGNANISGPAMHRCAEEGRAVNFMDGGGRFKARLVGPTSGNVLLRQAQYEAHRDEERAVPIVRALVGGKIRNMRVNIARAARETKNLEDAEALRACAEAQARLLTALPEQANTGAIRGIEGQASALYFEVFGAMLTVSPEAFCSAFVAAARRATG